MRHVPARIRAAAALLGAGGHAQVVGHPIAVLRAALADFSTRGTCMRMKIGAPEHKIGAGLADLRAIHHEPNMIALGMHAALLQAVLQRLRAGLVAVEAQLDASKHFFTQLTAFGVGHWLLLSVRKQLDGQQAARLGRRNSARNSRLRSFRAGGQCIGVE
jgi:hypothetical protein